jgi:hypothetical protein
MKVLFLNAYGMDCIKERETLPVIGDTVKIWGTLGERVSEVITDLDEHPQLVEDGIEAVVAIDK